MSQYDDIRIEHDIGRGIITLFVGEGKGCGFRVTPGFLVGVVQEHEAKRKQWLSIEDMKVLETRDERHLHQGRN